MRKGCLKFFLILTLIIGAIVFYIVAAPMIIPHTNAKNVHVVITKGSSMADIAETLADADVISSPLAFMIAAKFSEKGKRLQSGVYGFPNDLTVMDALSIVSEGRYQVEKWVTIPEGSTVRRIASILQRKLGLDSARTMTLARDPNLIAQTGFHVRFLEGYLLPDTYRFKITATSKDVLLHMAKQMRAFTAPYARRIDSMGRTLHQIVTMASIVEGETRLAEERARVAGVYYNRLRIGMLLQADPTVQYILPDGPRRLLYSDLRRDSKYNTYKYKGLPPGPINNPGRAAIHAALYPEKHVFLFFVADGAGGHIFSRNAGEHQQAVAEYRRHQRRMRAN